MKIKFKQCQQFHQYQQRKQSHLDTSTYDVENTGSCLVGWFMVFNATFTIFQLYHGGQFYWWGKP